MRTVKLYWRVRATPAQKKAELRTLRELYDSVTVNREFVTVKAANNDTRFVWVATFSEAFRAIE